MTAMEYLAIELPAKFKSEFIDGEISPWGEYPEPGTTCRAGASWEHNILKTNLICGIGGRMEGSPYRTTSSETRVATAPDGDFVYPDIVIHCRPDDFIPHGDSDTLLNPHGVIEITSPVTMAKDHGVKVRLYRSIASLRDYVLVAQDKPFVEVYFRQSEGVWGHVAYKGLEAALVIPSIAMTIPLAEIYCGVMFPPKRLQIAELPGEEG